MKKILILIFPVESPGGIRYSVMYTEYGLRKIGCVVDKACVTLNKSLKPDIEIYNKLYDNVKYIVGFEKKEWLDEYRTIINDYDYILIHNPAPHKLKNYISENWKVLYDILFSLKNIKDVLITIHDPYINKYYPWFWDILNKWECKIFCMQTKFADSLIGLTKGKIYRYVMPYIEKYSNNEFNTIINNKDDLLIVDLNEFKFCKNKDMIFDYDFLKNYRIIEFGSLNNFSGRMFLDLLRNKIDWNNIEVKGWVEDKNIIYNILKKVSFGLDLSAFSNVFCNMDMTILEYIDAGVMTVYNPKCTLDSMYNFKGIPINSRLIYNKDIVLENKMQLKKCDAIIVAEKILEFLDDTIKNVRFFI